MWSVDAHSVDALVEVDSDKECLLSVLSCGLLGIASSVGGGDHALLALGLLICHLSSRQNTEICWNVRVTLACAPGTLEAHGQAQENRSAKYTRIFFNQFFGTFGCSRASGIQRLFANRSVSHQKIFFCNTSTQMHPQTNRAVFTVALIIAICLSTAQAQACEFLLIWTYYFLFSSLSLSFFCIL